MKLFFKLLAALLGYHLLGITGAIIAFIILSLVLARPDSRFTFHVINTVRAQQTFFNATFAVMGCIAKADGRVSEREIHVARMIMDQMGLTGIGKQRAIETFTRGKQADFNLAATLQALKHASHYPYLLKLFVDIQVQAVYAAGHVGIEKIQLLQYIAAQLNCPPINFAAIEAAMRGQSQAYSNSYGGAHRPTQQINLEAAYNELGISPVANEAEIKRAYRKLMSQNHPDKLVSKGLPADMIKIATEKTQRIQKAYEQIKQARGI